MKFEHPYYSSEVESTEKDDEIFFRLRITGHKPLAKIKDQIFDLEDFMFEGFLEEFDNAFNARTALQLFVDKDRIKFIQEEEFPITIEKRFSINEILKEGQIEKSLINGDMFSGNGALLTEKTLILIEFFQTIRPHVHWIKYWNEE